MAPSADNPTPISRFRRLSHLVLAADAQAAKISVEDQFMATSTASPCFRSSSTLPRLPVQMLSLRLNRCSQEADRHRLRVANRPHRSAFIQKLRRCGVSKNPMTWLVLGWRLEQHSPRARARLCTHGRARSRNPNIYSLSIY